MSRHLLNIGDRGERYEIVAVNQAGQQIILGWSDYAEAYKEMVARHPAWRERVVVDRQKERDE